MQGWTQPLQSLLYWRLPFSPNPDTPVLIYCRTGRRAEYAGEALVASGYRHVYNFLGVTQWPYELVR